MSIFSCFLPKSVVIGQTRCPSISVAPTAVVRPSHVLPRTENAKFVELLDALSALEGDGVTLLQGACQTICERLEAAQASVSLLGSDHTATVVACAGLDEQGALGRRLGSCLLDSDSQQSIPLMEAVLQLHQDCPNISVVFRDRDESCDTRLPLEWQHLACERQCHHFAAAVMVAGGIPLGVLSIAARGPTRPACWTAEALRSIALMLSGYARCSQNLADALASLHSATTLSGLVEAVGAAAVEVSTSVAHMGGQVRVAFIPPDASAAAIFQPQSGEGGDAGSSVTSPLVAWSRRASCEYFMTNNGGVGGSSSTGALAIGLNGTSRRSTATRGSIDAAIAAALNNAAPLTADGLRRASLTELNNRRIRSRLSFTMPCDSGPAMKGHTLHLTGTLLADALSREAAGLCISDCASYVQDKRTFPRDTVLSRGAVMPQSLALATVSAGGRPLLAVYLAYSCTLPQPLLQAVVGKLQQLLQTITPLITSKIQGALRHEWEYLKAQLEETVKRKGSGDANTSASNHGATFGRLTSEQETLVKPTGTAAGCAITVVDAADRFVDGALDPTDCSVMLNDVCEPCVPSPFSTAAAAGPGYGDGLAVPQSPGGPRRRLALVGPTAVRPGDAPQTMSSMFAARRLLTPANEGSGGGSATGSGTDSCDDSNPSRSQYALSSSLGCDSSRPAPNRRMVSALRSVSFKLEAAHKPRGASRLAPIITIMHERLKAAQAAQMTCVTSESRKADLQSLKLLQEVGKGGYGTVYRGMYHGSEVAVKVIQEKELAALKKGAGGETASASSTGICAISAEVTLHKQHLHDAIELVASVSVSHPNIVQVLSFFTDCQLQGPDGRGMSAGPADSAVDHLEGEGVRADRCWDGYPRLVHMPSLLESPGAGQDISTGGISVALVMEFMDAGSLSDAITNRIFFERLETHPNGGGRAGRGFWAVSMRSVYSTLLEVALALRHMHSLHLVHCDLKPQNVLLKSAPRDPRGFTSKLSDFGLAKTLARDEQGQLVIDEAVASGTITHVAPEVFMGNKSLGAAVDVYAFGIIMFQVLCGMRLYDGMSAQEIANAVAHRHLRPTLPAWVPTGYRALAERCWHELPSVRPSAEELVRQLEKLSDFKRRGTDRPYSGANTASAIPGFQI